MIRSSGGTGWPPLWRYIFEKECALAGAPSLPVMGLKLVDMTGAAPSPARAMKRALHRGGPETLIVVTNDHETGGMALVGSLTALHPRVSGQKGSQGAFGRQAQEFREKQLPFEQALPVIQDFEHGRR